MAGYNYVFPSRLLLGVEGDMSFPNSISGSQKLEHRFYDFPGSGVLFLTVAQHYDSDLMLHNVLLGLNYKLGNRDDEAWSDESQSETGTSNNWAIHGQTTYINQYAPSFRSPYVGPQSLKPNQARETWDATLYAGLRLWSGAELWVDPEIKASGYRIHTA